MVSGKETGVAQVTGTLYFNRRNYGMDSDIPFIKIADRIEVNVALRAKRIGRASTGLQTVANGA